MVVEVIAGHTEIISVDAAKRIFVFFELVRRDYNIVASDEIQTGCLVIGDKRIADARVLIAVEQLNTIAAVLADGNAVDKNFINSFGFDTVSAFLVARDTKVRQLNPPHLGLLILFIAGRVLYKQSGFGFGVDVLDMRGGA